MASKREKSERRKKWALGTLGAGMALSTGLVLSRNDSEQSSSLSPDLTLSVPEETARSRMSLVERTPPKASRQAVGPRISERISIHDAENVGILIDTPASYWERNHIELAADHNNHIRVSSAPHWFRTPAEYVRADYSNKDDDTQGAVDPLVFLPDHASPQQIHEALAAIKLQYHHGYYDDTAAEELCLSLNNHRHAVQPQLVEEKQGKSEVTSANTSQRIMMRINLGSTSSGTYTWIKRLLDIPQELLTTIDREVNPHDPRTRFLEQAITDPVSGEISEDGIVAIKRIFALEPKDRQAFFDAVLRRDKDKAQQILLYLSDIIPIDERIFDVFRALSQQAQQSGVEKSSFAREIQYAISYTDYNKLGEDPEEQHNTVGRIIKNSVTADQYKSLRKYHVHLCRFLCEYLYDHSHSSNYYNFLNAAEHYLKTPTKSNPLPFTLTDHTFNAVQRDLQLLMGNGAVGGWVDNMSRDQNLITLLSLLRQRANLIQYASGSESPDGRSHLKRHLAVRNGEAFLTLELPTGDIDTANRVLLVVSKLMHAASTGMALPGSAYDDYGAPKSLPLRLLEFHANDLTDLDEMASARVMGPSYWLRSFTGASVTEPERVALQNPSGEENPYRFSEPVSTGGITVMQVQKKPPATFAKLTDTGDSPSIGR
ncbi:MAG: hypothetical protein AB7L92_02850 [Alphaproteobacteria bacterium]